MIADILALALVLWLLYTVISKTSIPEVFQKTFKAIGWVLRLKIWRFLFQLIYILLSIILISLWEIVKLPYRILTSVYGLLKS